MPVMALQQLFLKGEQHNQSTVVIAIRILDNAELRKRLISGTQNATGSVNE